ncbi:MAG: O-antigen ligase domain-containing protein [Pedosphaera sp.]|nr:O-antigen ligase domain-containing protein [Pedosphaera sp.]
MTDTAAQPSTPSQGQRLYALFVGLFLAFTLFKVGNPVILDHRFTPPQDAHQWLLFVFPSRWAMVVLVPLAVIGLALFGRFRPAAPRWLVWLPLVWFGWQCLSATQTVSRQLTAQTLPHLGACALCFYLALFVLGPMRRPERFLWGAVAGLALLLAAGFQQHFGGLEETRQWIYETRGMENLTPEMKKKLASNRIFSQLVYPNAFAGAILLLLPLSLVWIWQISERLAIATQWLLTLLLAAAGLGCLYWTGSKGGWLVALAMGLAASFRLSWSRRAKFAVAAAVLMLGLAGFTWKYHGYFAKGATSVGARFDYWDAAWKTAVQKPWLGSGPGTFQVVYAQLKRPDSEMARLAHNDYLEQASDSGWIGFLAYLAFWAGSLAFLYRKSVCSPLAFAVWLGLAGWALQEMAEFGLYIPALAWPAFLLLGCLCGGGFVVDEGGASPLESPGR